jgi:hypothetical protein
LYVERKLHGLFINIFSKFYIFFNKQIDLYSRGAGSVGYVPLHLIRRISTRVQCGPKPCVTALPPGSAKCAGGWPPHARWSLRVIASLLHPHLRLSPQSPLPSLPSPPRLLPSRKPIACATPAPSLHSPQPPPVEIRRSRGTGTLPRGKDHFLMLIRWINRRGGPKPVFFVVIAAP